MAFSDIAFYERSFADANQNSKKKYKVWERLMDELKSV